MNIERDHGEKNDNTNGTDDQPPGNQDHLTFFSSHSIHCAGCYVLLCCFGTQSDPFLTRIGDFGRRRALELDCGISTSFGTCFGFVHFRSTLYPSNLVDKKSHHPHPISSILTILTLSPCFFALPGPIGPAGRRWRRAAQGAQGACQGRREGEQRSRVPQKEEEQQDGRQGVGELP